MTIKQMFPKMLLALGLMSTLLVLTSGRVAYATVTTSDNYDESGRKISTTQKSSEGWEITTTYDPVTGGIKSSSTKYTDGSTEAVNYASKPPCTASFFMGPNCAVSSTKNTEPDGSTRTRNYVPPCTTPPCKPSSTSSYDPKGGLGYGSTETCDAKGKCDKVVQALDPSTRKKLGDKFQIKPLPPAGTKPTEKPPVVPSGGKDQVKADVLKQIGDKPLGDLSGAKEQVNTGWADQIRKRGEAVELNPQPLPPGPPPPPDKLGGKVQFDKKKLQTDALQRFKDKVNIHLQSRWLCCCPPEGG